MLITDIGCATNHYILKSALILGRILRATGTAAQRTAKATTIGWAKGAKSEQYFKTDLEWMDVQEVTKVHGAGAPKEESPRETENAVMWKITTRGSPELAHIPTPESIYPVAEEPQQANEKWENLVYTDQRQASGVERATSILSKIKWSPEVACGINMFPHIYESNGIWRNAIKWLDQNEDHQEEPNRNWDRCDLRPTAAVNQDPELAIGTVRIEWNKGQGRTW